MEYIAHKADDGREQSVKNHLEDVAKLYLGLIGNDLETSEILCFTSFCSNSKERFS